MQCRNCGFENLPGLEACARCTSTLSLDAVSVEPPRASRWGTAAFLSRVGNRVRATLQAILHSFRDLRPRLEYAEVHPYALLLSIIPGLGHLRIGRRPLGWLLLSVWLAFLLLTILSIGTEWNWFFVAGMAGTHATTVITLFAANLGYERLFMRLAFGLCVALGLWFLVYSPVGWLATRFYLPMPITDHWRGTDLIARGDSLLAEGPWLRPATFARGDLVAYTIHALQSNGFALDEGMGVDRVVGVPGDHIQVTEGELLVNGRSLLPRESPLGAIPRWVSHDIQLRENQYAIFPTRLNLYIGAQGAQVPPPHIVEAFTVSYYENIAGRVVLRLRPLSRLGRIQ